MLSACLGCLISFQRCEQQLGVDAIIMRCISASAKLRSSSCEYITKCSSVKTCEPYSRRMSFSIFVNAIVCFTPGCCEDRCLATPVTHAARTPCRSPTPRGTSSSPWAWQPFRAQRKTATMHFARLCRRRSGVTGIQGTSLDGRGGSRNIRAWWWYIRASPRAQLSQRKIYGWLARSRWGARSMSCSR